MYEVMKILAYCSLLTGVSHTFDRKLLPRWNVGVQGQGPASYFGVFDGHNGTDAAIYGVSHLHQYLAESAFYPDSAVKALRDACIKTDKNFSIKAQIEVRHLY